MHEMGRNVIYCQVLLVHKALTLTHMQEDHSPYHSLYHSLLEGRLCHNLAQVDGSILHTHPFHTLSCHHTSKLKILWAEASQELFRSLSLGICQDLHHIWLPWGRLVLQQVQMLECLVLFQTEGSLWYTISYGRPSRCHAYVLRLAQAPLQY